MPPPTLPRTVPAPSVSQRDHLSATFRFGFLLMPKFSMMAFTAAVEPLRAANRLMEREAYDWTLLSADGELVEASNGISLQPKGSPDDTERFDAVAVAGGIDPQAFNDPKAFAWLRKQNRRGAELFGLCTGSHALARAGLLGDYRFTIHWENLAGFLEEFPDLDVTNQVFEVDRDRSTCAGGTAALDLMLHRIGEDHGRAVAAAVSEQFIHTEMRGGETPQRMGLRQRVGVSHPKLLAAIDVIETSLSHPLSTPDLAREVGLSTRQLERLFRLYLGQTPTRYYLESRLRYARQLLAQTSLPVLEVAIATGFTSASHFAKSYRALFDRSPRSERQVSTLPTSGRR